MLKSLKCEVRSYFEAQGLIDLIPKFGFCGGVSFDQTLASRLSRRSDTPIFLQYWLT